MIDLIKQAAVTVGIVAIITNSNELIEVQLNSLTRKDDAPIFLISWDIDTALSFNEHGFLNKPSSKITGLLCVKAYDTSKLEMEKSAVEMGKLFQKFIQKLYNLLIPYGDGSASPITNCNYKLVPKHGSGKHSGILANFEMISAVSAC